MEGINIELLVARVKEKYPEAKHESSRQRKAVHFKRLQIFGFSAGTLRNGSESLSSAEQRQIRKISFNAEN